VIHAFEALELGRLAGSRKPGAITLVHAGQNRLDTEGAAVLAAQLDLETTVLADRNRHNALVEALRMGAFSDMVAWLSGHRTEPLPREIAG